MEVEKAIKLIEEAFNIQLEKYEYGLNQPNYYEIRSNYISSLQLTNVHIENLDFLQFEMKANRVKIYDSTISNISELLKFEPYSLSLNNVTFTNDYLQKEITEDLYLEFSPKEVYINNTNFNAHALLTFNNLTFFFLHDCHIENFYAISQIASLYQLNLSNITFGKNSETYPAKIEKRYHSIMTITDCTLENIGYLLPFDNLRSLTLENCRIEQLHELGNFPNLESLSLDSTTTINNTELNHIPSKNKFSCEITKTDKPINLKNLLPIAQSINELSFKNFNTKQLKHIKHFTQVNSLEFEKCTLSLDHFSAIAEKISSISLQDSVLKKTKRPYLFNNLESIDTFAYDEENVLFSLKTLLPFKNQIKKLDLWDRKTKDLHLLQKFTALNELKITGEFTIGTAKQILKISSLQKLKLSVETERKYVLSLKHLQNIESLNLSDSENIEFRGFEKLHKLKHLKIQDTLTDVNKFPEIKTLKRLHFDFENYKLNGIAQFPNLEELKLGIDMEFNLGTHEKLKVLDMGNTYIKDLNCFDELPNLEKLDLSCHFSHDVDLTALNKLSKLKYLSFMESYELNSLEHLGNLKNLEYLDLYQTKVEDVSILNQLKKLKEVNLMTAKFQTKKEFLQQLENPEIAVFIGLPRVQFSIWQTNEFGI